MITADKLKLLTNMPASMLTTGIRSAGYKKDQFLRAVFRGITNGGQFCYSCEYKDEIGEIQPCQVFVSYDPTADRVSVDY